MATTIYVNTDASSGTYDGTTLLNGFLTLDAAIDDMQANLVPVNSDYIIECSGVAADTSAVQPPGNITGTGNIIIRANPAEGDGKYNGDALISTSHYRIDTSGTANLRPLRVFQIVVSGGLVIDGIQALSNLTSAAWTAFQLTANGITMTVQNCRSRNTATSGTGMGDQPGGSGFGSDGVEFFNNIVVGFENGINVDRANGYSPEVTICNNTVYSCGTGIRLDLAGVATVETILMFNNVMGLNTNDYFEDVDGTSGTLTRDYDSGDDSDIYTTETNGVDLSSTGSGETTDHAAAWTSPGTGSAADFSVKSGSVLFEAGVPNSTQSSVPLTDINGITRDTTNPCIGAFELVSGSDINGTGSFSAQAATTSSVGIVIVSGGGTPSAAAATVSSSGRVILSGAGSLAAADAIAGGTTALVKVKASPALQALVASTSGTIAVEVTGAGTLVSGAATMVAYQTASVLWFAIRPLIKSITRKSARVVHTPLDRR